MRIMAEVSEKGLASWLCPQACDDVFLVGAGGRGKAGAKKDGRVNLKRYFIKIVFWFNKIANVV